MPREGQSCSLKLQVGTWVEAQSLCDNGLIWEAQIFDCEPYSPELELRQCFSCHGFGHHARYCTRPARCGHCGGAAHQEGEKACQQYDDDKPKKCVNCTGSHTPWSRRCPALQQQLNRIHEAYAHRPLGFKGAGAESSLGTGSDTTLQQSSNSDDFTEVRSRKRRLGTSPAHSPAPRGRPRELSRPMPGNMKIPDLLAASQASQAAQALQASQACIVVQTQEPPRTQAGSYFTPMEL
jgi:hypothetical protein